MTFSIDDLPAPFGPMMARISPLRMSKLTLVSARTPPNRSEMPSTRQQHLAGPALRAVHLWLARRSGSTLRRAPVSRIDEIGLDPALAPVLERHLALDVNGVWPGIDGLDQLAA